MQVNGVFGHFLGVPVYNILEDTALKEMLLL